MHCSQRQAYRRQAAALAPSMRMLIAASDCICWAATEASHHSAAGPQLPPAEACWGSRLSSFRASQGTGDQPASRRCKPEEKTRRRQSCAVQGYNSSVDWWGLGVLLYVLLTGRQPFSSPKTVSAPVTRSCLLFPGRVWLLLACTACGLAFGRRPTGRV